MYRCMSCDTPAQMGHSNGCRMDLSRGMVYRDPWDFEEVKDKVDIQAGVRVSKLPEKEREGVIQ